MKSQVTGWGWAVLAMSAYGALGAAAGALLFLPFHKAWVGAALGALLAPWLVSGNLR